MEMQYIIQLVKYAVDSAYGGKQGVYTRTQQVLAIRGVTLQEFEQIETRYYCGEV